MEKIGYVLKAMFMIFVAWRGIQLYTGKINLSEEHEKLRKQRVEKYGDVILFFSIILIFGAIYFLINIFL